MSEQLGELTPHKLIIMVVVNILAGAACFKSGSTTRIIVAPPVDKRIIQVKPEILAMTLIGKHLYHILAIWSGIHNVIIAFFGLEHRKTLMMPRCETHILRTGILERIDPLLGIERMRIKCICKFLILGIVDIAVGHSPFARCEHGIKPPMDENAKFCVAKLLARSQIVGRRHISLLWTSRSNQHQRRNQ